MFKGGVFLPQGQQVKARCGQAANEVLFFFFRLDDGGGV